MGDVAWCGRVPVPGVRGLLPHLGHALADFLELAAILEHVACLLFTILLVDVEVAGAWTR